MLAVEARAQRGWVHSRHLCNNHHLPRHCPGERQLSGAAYRITLELSTHILAYPKLLYKHESGMHPFLFLASAAHVFIRYAYVFIRYAYGTFLRGGNVDKKDISAFFFFILAGVHSSAKSGRLQPQPVTPKQNGWKRRIGTGAIRPTFKLLP